LEPRPAGCLRARPFERRADRGEHPLGLIARGARGLGGGQPLAVEERGIREGAADIDSEEHGLFIQRGGPWAASLFPPSSDRAGPSCRLESGVSPYAAAISTKLSSRCLCDGQYLLPGRGTRWHGVPLRVLA